MAIYIVLNLAIGAGTPGIDNAAHVGGLLTGAAIGVALFVLDRWHGNQTTADETETWR